MGEPERIRYQGKIRSNRWAETRERIIHKANGICEECGFKAQIFNVHHEKYIGDHPSDTPDEFLKALCQACHDGLHWVDRLKKYAAHKRLLGLDLTPCVDRELIEFYRV